MYIYYESPNIQSTKEKSHGSAMNIIIYCKGLVAGKFFNSVILVGSILVNMMNFYLMNLYSTYGRHKVIFIQFNLFGYMFDF